MVGMGVLMLVVSWTSTFWFFRYQNIAKPLAYLLVPMSFAGWVATVAGWYVTEIGRQPWLVTGVLKTADAISDVPAPMIGISLTMYLATYAFLIVTFITTVFYMARKAGEKTDHKTPPPASGQAIVEAITE